MHGELDDSQRRSAVTVSRSDRQYLHNDSTAAVQCGAQARYAMHTANRNVVSTRRHTREPPENRLGSVHRFSTLPNHPRPTVPSSLCCTLQQCCPGNMYTQRDGTRFSRCFFSQSSISRLADNSPTRSGPGNFSLLCNPVRQGFRSSRVNFNPDAIPCLEQSILPRVPSQRTLKSTVNYVAKRKSNTFDFSN